MVAGSNLRWKEGSHISKGGGKSQTVKQDNSPWKVQQPYLRNLFEGAQQNVYGANTVAAQSPYTQQAVQRMAGEAGPNSLTGAAGQQLRTTLEGGFNNPYAQGALGDVMDMARSKINAQFSGDNSGNSAHQEWLGRGLVSAASPFAAQLFDSERNRQMSASQLAPGVAASGIGQLAGAGQIQDAYQQRLVDNDFEALRRYQQLVGGGGYGSAGSTTQPMTQGNVLGGMMGGALGGAGLGSMMAAPGATGLAAVGGWPFLAGGAALGLLGGL